MKTHFLSLFSPENYKKTLIFLVPSVVLIITSQIVGIDDNPLGILLMGVGIILLYYSFVHIWKTSENFVSLIYVSLGLIALTVLVINIFVWLHKAQYLREDLIMGIIFLICIPLILVGAIGALSRPKKRR